MFDVMRPAVTAAFELIRNVDELLARGGIANAQAAVRANDHRRSLVAAARSARTEDLRLPTSA